MRRKRRDRRLQLLLLLITWNEARQYSRHTHNLDEIVGYQTWDELLRNTAAYTCSGADAFGQN